jgi:hypothetical protein
MHKPGAGNGGCTRRTKSGGICDGPAITGTDTCRMHAGRRPAQARAIGAVAVEVAAWGLTDQTVDPAETLLRLLTQSARRAALYADLLERQYVDKGVAALVGVKVALDADGNAVDLGEYIRGLAELEAAERDRCAKFAKLALDAGIAERQVRLAERQGALVADAVGRILDALGLTAEQQALVATVVPRELRAIAG